MMLCSAIKPKVEKEEEGVGSRVLCPKVAIAQRLAGHQSEELSFLLFFFPFTSLHPLTVFASTQKFSHMSHKMQSARSSVAARQLACVNPSQ